LARHEPLVQLALPETRHQYPVSAYRRDILRACQRAGVPERCPTRRRHNVATCLGLHYGTKATGGNPPITSQTLRLARQRSGRPGRTWDWNNWMG
jgi:hypothetical protein